MPCLTIHTNVPKSKIPKDFVDKIISTLSKSVKKPENNFICLISGDAHLNMFGDSQTPGAVATLESIGNLGPEENKVITRQLSDFVEAQLEISPNRFFLSFNDLENYNIGIQGTTVKALNIKNP